MAEIDEALRTYLLTISGLTALIGTRIYSDIMPSDATFPCVVYLKVSDVKDHCYSKQSELEHPTIQFSCYAITKSGARAVNNLIKTALCEYTGALSGITVQYVKLINEMSSAEQSGDGTQKIYVDDLEFEINFIKE